MGEPMGEYGLPLREELRMELVDAQFTVARLTELVEGFTDETPWQWATDQRDRLDAARVRVRRLELAISKMDASPMTPPPDAAVAALAEALRANGLIWIVGEFAIPDLSSGMALGITQSMANRWWNR